MRYSALIIFFALITNDAVSKQSITVKKTFEKEKNEEAGFFSNLSAAFESPLVRDRLAAGTKAINRSIENVMDALLYQLMDNKWILGQKGDLKLNLESNRKVYNSPSGDFVVVDRMTIGPEYNRPIGDVRGVPVNLNAGLNADYYEIYPRSDALRLTEAKQDNYLSWSLKNWFGALNVLTRILPPSFNSNELYDPGRTLAPPFSIPLTKDGFETMPLNSIRSYSIRGGVNLPFSLDAIIDPQLKERLKSIEAIGVSLPYSIFITGEYRINVLRKSQNVAWVGLSKTKSVGHGISGIVGKTLYVLSDWAKNIPFDGIPLPFFLIDSDISSDVLEINSSLYEFNLKTEEGRRSYEKAVLGDFDFAFKNYQRGAPGVVYHFTKNDFKLRSRSKNKAELGLLAYLDLRASTDTESSIRDKNGTFHLLESSEQFGSQFWDILVGETKSEISSSLTLHVDKVDANEDGSEWMYKYKALASPWLFSMNANIFDSFTSGIEIKRYKKDIEDLSGIKLKGFPSFPTKNTMLEPIFIKNRLRTKPYIRAQNYAIPPLLLGRFNANIKAMASTSHLRKLYKNAHKDFYKIYQKVLFPDERFQTFDQNFPRLYPLFARFINGFSSPLRVVGVNRLLEYKRTELAHRTQLLGKMRSIKDPLKHRDRFSEFIETDYPKELTSALIKTLKKYGAPISVNLNTKAADGLSPREKILFEKLNNRIYKSGTIFRYPKRLKLTALKTKAFEPYSLIKNPKLKILDASIKTNYQKNAKEGQTPLQLALTVDGFSMAKKKVNLYLKFENSGSLDIGKLLLSESVKERKISVFKDKIDKGLIVINLDKDPDVSSFLLDQALSLGFKIKLSLALSDEEKNWSKVRSLVFSVNDQSLNLHD